MDFKNRIIAPPSKALFTMEEYCVWCGTMIHHKDDRYYLLFSRWPKTAGHDGWLTCSEVCYAVSDSPNGPFEYGDIILAGQGEGRWDADCIHNPTVLPYKGNYYLYYMANKGNGEYWSHRNNQRIGVAVSQNPWGPWTPSDQPVIDVSRGKHDHLMTSNPTVCLNPDGEILMVYKAVSDGILPKGGDVVCGVARAEHPLGPFIKEDKPIMQNPEHGWSVEDPYIWYEDDRYYALVKDFQGYFSGKGKNSVALFESFDGSNWKAHKTPCAFELEINWESGKQEKVLRMERPQMLIEEGNPRVLMCAVTSDPHGIDCGNIQFLIK